MPGASIALIANPGARSGDPEELAAHLRAEGARVSVFELDEAERAAASGASRVALAGGDGSVAPAAAAAGRAGIPLAVIPAGTANDFARRLDLPGDARAAARLAVRGERLRALDLAWMRRAPTGEAETTAAGDTSASHPPTAPSGRSAAGSDDARPFVNVASLGLPAPAAERAGSWKRVLGPLAYAAGALGAALTAGPVRCRADCDGRTVHDGPAWQLTVACTGAFGAGSQVEEADPADGRLDLVAVEAGARLRLIPFAYGLRRGGLAGRTGVLRAGGKRIDVDAPADTAYNVDGELVTHGPAAFTVEARAFRLVVG